MDILKEIGEARSIAITGHERPDGDCIGASLALYIYLKKALKNVEISVFLEDIPTIFNTLKGAEDIQSAEGRCDKFDVFFVLDSTVDRTGPSKEMAMGAGKIINIDHHVTNAAGCGDSNYVVPQASSTCEVLYELMDKKYMDVDIATSIYTGIINDCGVFQYSCTSKRTLEIAGELIEYGFDFPALIEKTFYEKTYVQNQLLGRALLESILFMDGKCIVSSIDKATMDFYGAKPKHLDGIASQLRNTRGVDCAIFMYELENGVRKVSMRSNEKVDVAKVASNFGGGGHARAAGCTVTGNFYDIVNSLSGFIEAQLYNK